MKKWILVVMLFVSGCISKSEYRKFIDAADKYNQLVTQDYLRRLRNDAHVNSQTIKNREVAAAEFSGAITSAKKRVE